MFGFLQRKPSAPAKRRSLPLVSEMNDDQLVDSVRRTFDGAHVVVAALFLVALENLPVYYSVFCNSKAREPRDYPATMEGMVSFIADAHAPHAGGGSDEAEVNGRKWFYLYIAALLTVAQTRAKAKPELWDELASTWVRLLDGARVLRATLDKTALWKPNETDFFETVRTEDDGEKWVESVMMPPELRHHAKVNEWRDRDLTPEQRAEFAQMDAEFRARWNGTS